MLYIWYVEWYRKDSRQIVSHRGIFGYDRDAGSMDYEAATRTAQDKIDNEFTLRYGTGAYEVSNIRCYPADGQLYYL